MPPLRVTSVENARRYAASVLQLLEELDDIVIAHQ